MDIYHVWCNLRPGAGDVEFSERVEGYLGNLRQAGAIEGYRLTRRKLGLGPAVLGEFHLAIEVRDLAQLDAAFLAVAARTSPVEDLHQAVNSLVCDFQSALYRDFPDPVRRRGQEKF